MTKLVAISRETHKTAMLLPFRQFDFSKNQNLCPILMEECPVIMSQSPIVFAKDETGNILICSLLGLIPQQNSFVADNGTWKTPYYAPAMLRAYPFSLQKNDNQKEVLCVDNTSGILSDSFQEGAIKIFNEDGENSEHLNKILGLLNAIQKQRIQTSTVVDIILSLDLLEEWNVNIKITDEERKLKGLLKINKEKLYNLSETNFCSLREYSAMDLIFSHLFSLKSLDVLGKLLVPNTTEKDDGSYSLKDRAVKKQQTESALELDSLVKNLLLDD